MTLFNIEDLSIVVPVYNSEASLEILVECLNQVLPGISTRYELLLVNDGSRDRSWEVICKLTGQHTWVRGINLLRNFGQHNALLCGIRAACGSVVVTMDDDLQHPPEEISKLLGKLAEGYEVVYGTPVHEQHGRWRDMASQITKLALQTAMGAETARKVSAFRAFHTRIRNAFADYGSPYVSIDVLLTWGATHFATVPVLHKPRRLGKSNYTLRLLLQHAANMMTGFSTLPLQLASLLGFSFAFFGVLVLIYVIGRYLIQGGVVQGFAFLASTIAIFSGVQLFALGIIGEYLARMHFRLMDRPSYVVKDEAASRSLNE